MSDLPHDLPGDPPAQQRARRDALERAIAHYADRLATPALVVDLDAVEHNIAAMLRRVGTPARWRPHVKTLKQPTLVGLLLDAGVYRFKAATPAEVELVLDAAADRALPRPVDVLLAYPATAPQLFAMVTLRRAHPHARIGLLADSPEHLRALVDGLGRPVELPAFDLWLDVDLGMHRTGRPPADWHALQLPECPWLHLVGLHGYDGHLDGTERAAAHQGYDALLELARRMPDGVHQLCTSGTHAYAHALAHPGLAQPPWDHQVGPGTIVLSDRRSHVAAADLGLRTAAFVLSRVIARPGHDRITLDAGSKALAPDCPEPACAVLAQPHLRPLAASEEHRPVLVEDGPRPALGSRQWLVPDHVCTTVNLHAEALYVRTDAMAGSGPVRARGHRPWLPLLALALALGPGGGIACQPITTEVPIQLMLPLDTDPLERADNVSVVLEPDGFSETLTADGLDFGLSFEVPPDDTLRTLSVYLAEGDALLAWGRTPPFRYRGATSGLGLLLTPAGALSPLDIEFSQPDAAARIAPVADVGALVLASDGSTLFLDAYRIQLKSAARLDDPPDARDGCLVGAADGGVVRVAWAEGVAAWRFDVVVDAWQPLPLEGDLRPRPGAIAWTDEAGRTLWLAGGDDASVVSLALEGDQPRPLAPADDLVLDAPRPGGVALVLAERPLVVGGSDPDLPLAWRPELGVGAELDGDWIDPACAVLSTDPPQALCVGGQRDEAPSADVLRLTLTEGGLELELLAEHLPQPMADPRLFSDDAALFAQGDGHWMRLDRADLRVTELPSESPRATGGSLAPLPSGATVLVGGTDIDGAPLDRWYAYAPTLEP